MTAAPTPAGEISDEHDDLDFPDPSKFPASKDDD